MKNKAEHFCVAGTLAIAVGLWLERPSLAFIFCGGLALLVGVTQLRGTGRSTE